MHLLLNCSREKTTRVFDMTRHRADLLTQPLLMVAGSEAGSLWHSQELHAKAEGPKELFIIKGATHMDLYDGKGVDTAMSKLSPFFSRALA